MRRTTSLLGALILTLLAPTLFAQDEPTAPADPTEVKAAIAGLIDRAEGANPRDLRTVMQELAKLGKEKAGLAAIRASLKDAKPRARLALAEALAGANPEHAEEAAAALLTLVESQGPEAEAAAAALASRLFSRENLEKPETYSKKLAELLTAGTLAAPVRLATARALWRLGSSDEKSVARREILSFFKASDPDLRADGALALAEIDDVDQARPVLRELEAEPTERGRLAKAYLEREEEANAWRKRFDDFRKITDRKTASTAKRVDPGDPQLLNDIIAYIRERHIQGDQWTREELVAAAARGMLNVLDPHSTFLTSEEYARMFQQLTQEYGGIGAQVRTLGRVFTIVRPFFSGPAYRKGIRAGDQVLAIISEQNGVKTEWSTEGQPEEEIIKRLKGKPGTKLTLKVARRGWVEPKDFEIAREQIQIPLLESELLPGGIAYFDVQEFGREATHQLIRDFEALKKDGKVKGVIVDLRNNPGGFLEAARDMVQVFLPKGSKVCYTEGRQFGRAELLTKENPTVPGDMPVAILVNGYSASASEITAGALQDAGRAVIVGEHTYGKGSVQRIFELQSLPDEDFVDQDGNGIHDNWEKYTDANGNGKYDAGPRIKLTVERWFLPGGRSINTEFDREQRKVKVGGIDPDVKSPWPVPDLGKAAELDRIAGDETSKIKNYVLDTFEKNPDLARQLAVNDGKDVSRYPAFDELYQSLKTTLEKNDVRRLVRWRLRDRVAEDRGKMFPGYGFQGDMEEDPQLRDAVAILLKKLGTSFDSFSDLKAMRDHEKQLGIDLGPKADSTKPESSKAVTERPLVAGEEKPPAR